MSEAFHLSHLELGVNSGIEGVTYGARSKCRGTGFRSCLFQGRDDRIGILSHAGSMRSFLEW